MSSTVTWALFLVFSRVNCTLVDISITAHDFDEDRRLTMNAQLASGVHLDTLSHRDLLWDQVVNFVKISVKSPSAAMALKMEACCALLVSKEKLGKSGPIVVQRVGGCLLEFES